MWPPGRCEVIGAILLLAGLLLFGRALSRVIRTTRDRFTYGAPYRPGMLADRALGLLMTVPVSLLGAALVFLGLAQHGFQPTRAAEPVRVGRVEAKRSGWGKTAVEIVPEPLYPERRLLRGEIEGGRWAIAGDFISWSPWARALGLSDAHRVRALLGSADTTGMSRGAARPVVPIDAPPRAAALLLRLRRFLPFLTVREGTTSWFEPADRAIVILYVTPDGYVADAVAERGALLPGSR